MKKFVLEIFIGINILIILGMLCTGYADLLDPREWHIFSIAGYIFPAFIIANLVALVVWILINKKFAAIPIVGFVICCVPIVQYCPMHIGGDAPIGCLKIMTYNTWGFGAQGISEKAIIKTQEECNRELLQFIADQNCDVVCIQEPIYDSKVEHDIDSIIRPVMAYVDTCKNGTGGTSMIFSKHPIVRHEWIKYKSVGNLSVAFFLNVNGKELIVINNHLESNSFSAEEKEQFHDMVHGDIADSTSMKSESKFILKKLAAAAEKRAAQADAVAAYIKLHKGRSMIVCGDFNDIPISYTRRTIAKNITDCYVSTAFGPGFSYHKNAMYVRIDNVMCSENMEPFAFHVDKNCDLSDHYPVVGWVKWHNK